MVELTPILREIFPKFGYAISIASFFFAIFIMSYSAKRHGFLTVIPVIIYTTLSVFTIYGGINFISEDSITTYAAFGFFALICGTVVGFLLNRPNLKLTYAEKIKQKIDELKEDWRISAIVIAFCFSSIITVAFSKLVIYDSVTKEANFWYGFYQSWTAGFVAFVFLGAAGIIVSMYNPERENLRKRISILFGGRKDLPLDYITHVIENLGCYTRECIRNYKIVEFDETRKSYLIDITYTVKLRNFLNDVVTNHTTKFGYGFDDDDKITPEPEGGIYGHLIRYSISGNNVLDKRIDITFSGIEEKHDVRIYGTQEVTVETNHRVWCRVEAAHSLTIIRYAKTVNSFITNECSKNDVCISIKSNNKTKSILLPFGREVKIVDVENLYPDVLAYEFKLMEPSKTQ